MSDPTPEAIVQELLSRGVPASAIAEVNPTIGRQAQAGLLAPRLRAPDKIAERGAYIRDYGQINKDRDDLAKVYPMTSDLDRFHSLNTQRGTGGIGLQDYDGWERAAPWNWPGMLMNVVERQDPHIKEMSGISSGLQGKARPAGSGATSDFEQRLYRMGVPSPEKQGPTNDNIISYQKGVMAEQGDRLAFQEEFLRRNGSLSGSQDAWARYLKANPYAVTDDTGETRLNPRRTDWRQHFGLAEPTQETPARLPSEGKPKPDGWSSQLPKAQRSAALMYKGATASAGAKGNPFIPTSSAEFAKLPPGSWYLDDDGRAYQKGGR